ELETLLEGKESHGPGVVRRGQKETMTVANVVSDMDPYELVSNMSDSVLELGQLGARNASQVSARASGRCTLSERQSDDPVRRAGLWSAARSPPRSGTWWRGRSD